MFVGRRSGDLRGVSVSVTRAVLAEGFIALVMWLSFNGPW